MRRPDEDEEEGDVEDGRVEVEARRVASGRCAVRMVMVGVRLRRDDGRKGGRARTRR